MRRAFVQNRACSINHQEMNMKHKLAASCFVIGTMLAPIAVQAKDSDADRPNPTTFVKDSAITAKIKTRLAAENPGTLKHISIDTDRNGVVWMTGTVNNQSEAEQAVTIARNTEGVRSVRSSLTVQKDR
jgi:hyperosmotically inducible periplasmic protein